MVRDWGVSLYRSAQDSHPQQGTATVLSHRTLHLVHAKVETEVTADTMG